MDKDTLLQKIDEVVLTALENSHHGEYRYYDPPVVGFADANDPLFLELKKESVIGPVFKLPTEWLPGAVSVISFFLPFTKEIRLSNKPPGLASEQWTHGRFKGEDFSNHLRRFIISELTAAGGRAVAPIIEPDFVTDFTLYVSNWSERHVAYIAGLGTFSLNRSLITEKGAAGRIASVITDIPFTPSQRPYPSLYHNCLYLRENKCGACIKRCPSGAITKEGKDKYTCHQYLFIKHPCKEFADIHGYPYSSCGKCQTNVPCENKIP